MVSQGKHLDGALSCELNKLLFHGATHLLGGMTNTQTMVIRLGYPQIFSQKGTESVTSGKNLTAFVANDTM